MTQSAIHDYRAVTRCIACDGPLTPRYGHPDTDGYCSRECVLAQQRKIFGAPLVELRADRARPIASAHREQFEKAMRRAFAAMMEREA